MIIKISSLIQSLAETIDLVSSEVNNHHRRVACIAAYLGDALDLPPNTFETLVIASALHDIGGLTSKDRLDLLHFEEHTGNHAEFGYRLLKRFRPFSHIAPIVRYHHALWNHGNEASELEVPLESRIIFLADRIAVLIQPDFTLGHVEGIRRRIADCRGTYFMPALVDLFLELSRLESFWLDAHAAVSQPLFDSSLARNLHLNTEDKLALGRLYSQVIDFRSPFTAAHSAGVSAVAEALAGYTGFSSEERNLMRMAGYLHDIGKLVISEEILEKPAALTEDERYGIRCHTYYTNRLLIGIREFDTLRQWAALHHERLDGSGYPFHKTGDSLPLGSRILAVADVFVAVSEDRPYRAGMSRDRALATLTDMAESGALDGNVVRLLAEHVESIDGKRKLEQDAARREYRKFYAG